MFCYTRRIREKGLKGHKGHEPPRENGQKTLFCSLDADRDVWSGTCAIPDIDRLHVVAPAVSQGVGRRGSHRLAELLDLPRPPADHQIVVSLNGWARR